MHCNMANCLTLFAFLFAISVHTISAAPSYMNITLHMFSGRPDPVWRLNPQDPGYDVIATFVHSHNSTALPSVLGYKGFTVDTYNGHRQIVTMTIGKCSQPQFETQLLGYVKTLIPIGASEPLSGSIISYAENTIAGC